MRLKKIKLTPGNSSQKDGSFIEELKVIFQINHVLLWLMD